MKRIPLEYETNTTIIYFHDCLRNAVFAGTLGYNSEFKT